MAKKNIGVWLPSTSGGDTNNRGESASGGAPTKPVPVAPQPEKVAGDSTVPIRDYGRLENAQGTKYYEADGKFYKVGTGEEVQKSDIMGQNIMTHAGIIKDYQGIQGQAPMTEDEIRRDRIKSDIEAGKQFGEESIGNLRHADVVVRQGSVDESAYGTLAPGEVEKAEDLSTDLDRINTAVRQGRSEEVADILKRRKENLQGLSRGEMQAERDMAGQQINRASELQRRQLAAIQARTGVRGATAGAQQMQALTAAAQTRAGFERDLFLKNEQIKRQALGSYEASVGMAEQSEFQRQMAEMDRQKFNIGVTTQEAQLARQDRDAEYNRQNINIQRKMLADQFNEQTKLGIAQFNVQQQNLADQAKLDLQKYNIEQENKEKFGKMGASLGFAQLISAEKLGDAAIAAQYAAAASAAQSCFHPSTLIKMRDGSVKPIHDIRIGDDTAGGTVYALHITQAPKYDVYEYEGTIVAGSHAVMEDGEFVRVRMAKYSNPSIYQGLLYNIGVSNHRIYVNDVVYSDIDELDLVEEIDEMYLDGLNGVNFD